MNILVDKFNRALPAEILEAGYDKPTDLQLQTFSIINSGANLFALGPGGSGKSTAILMAVVRKLKEPFEKAPRALILVNDTEKAREMERLFSVFTRDSRLRSDCIHDNKDVQDQVNELYEGSDVIIATPKRLTILFLRNWINLNKLQMLALDDAHLLLKNGHKTSIDKLAISGPKCQRLVFAEPMSQRMQDQLSLFIPFSKTVEVGG